MTHTAALQDFSKPPLRCPDHQTELGDEESCHSSEEDGHYTSGDDDDAMQHSVPVKQGSSQAKSLPSAKKSAASASSVAEKEAASGISRGFFSKPNTKQPERTESIPKAPAPAVPDAKKTGFAAGFLSKPAGGAAKARPASGSASGPSAAASVGSRSAGAGSGLVRWTSPFDLAPESSYWQAGQAAPQLTAVFVKFWVQQCCRSRNGLRLRQLRQCLDHFIELDLEDAMQHYARYRQQLIFAAPVWDMSCRQGRHGRPASHHKQHLSCCRSMNTVSPVRLAGLRHWLAAAAVQQLTSAAV